MAEVEDWEEVGGNDGSQQQQDGGSGGQAPRGLRAHAKKVEEENKALQAKLAEFESAARRARIKAALEAKGFDPGVADVVPEQIAGDDAALDKWLTDKGALFAKKEAETNVNVGFVEDTLEEDSQGYMRVSEVASSALPASQHTNLKSQIMAADGPEALVKILKQQGNRLVV